MFNIMAFVNGHLAGHSRCYVSIVHRGLTRKHVCTPARNSLKYSNNAMIWNISEMKQCEPYWHLCCSKNNYSVDTSLTLYKYQLHPKQCKMKMVAPNAIHKLCQRNLCTIIEPETDSAKTKHKKRPKPSQVEDLQESDASKPLSEMAKEVFDVMESRKRLKNVKIDQSLIEKNMQALVDLGLWTVDVKHLFLHRIPLSLATEFEGTIKQLYEYGFSIERIYKMCKIAPMVFQLLSPNQTCERIENLRNIGFSQANILKLLDKYPNGLLLSTAEVQNRIEILCTLFKKEDVFNLCLKSPRVLEEDISVIQSKFDYVFHVMGITQRQMMYSNLFNHSLRHIEIRHNFLVRAGLFKKVKKDSGQKNTNPLLQDIMDTRHYQFVKRYGNMSVVDYKVFSELFEKERKDLEESEQDTDETVDEECSDDESYKKQ